MEPVPAVHSEWKIIKVKMAEITLATRILKKLFCSIIAVNPIPPMDISGPKSELSE